jgi:hypothetical protein
MIIYSRSAGCNDDDLLADYEQDFYKGLPVPVQYSTCYSLITRQIKSSSLQLPDGNTATDAYHCLERASNLAPEPGVSHRTLKRSAR